jgi:uncharacterized phage protein (TIGR02216 family)
MMFVVSAAKLCGQSAVLLGWRPDEFWAATPAELECVLAAMQPQIEAPLDCGDIQKLMEQFPDG